MPSVRNLAISPTNGNVVALAYGWAGQINAKLIISFRTGLTFPLMGWHKPLAFVPHGQR